MTHSSVVVLGLGLMGRPIARRLISAGFAVRGWNRSALPPELIQEIPLVTAPEEAAGADVCLLMLADSEATDAVLARVEPQFSARRLVIDMGTSDPARSREHALRLAARGVGWVDAPVSGGPEGAAKGTLAIMAGGTPADMERARPLLRTLGNVVHVGPAGAGHTVKIINQVIVGLTIEAVAEALILAERSGLDPRLVQQALAGGFADSKILQIHGTRMIERRYIPGAKVSTQLKDLRLAQGMAASLGVRLPHLGSAVVLYERLEERGESDLDHSALRKLLNHS